MGAFRKTFNRGDTRWGPPENFSNRGDRLWGPPGKVPNLVHVSLVRLRPERPEASRSSRYCGWHLECATTTTAGRDQVLDDYHPRTWSLCSDDTGKYS